MHLHIHRHKAKRKAQTSRSYPSGYWIRFLDRATFAMGIIGPFTDIPQILKILEAQTSAGVSVLAWAGAAVFDIPFLLYGIVHKDKAITTTYALWLIGNIIVVMLTVLYS